MSPPLTFIVKRTICIQFLLWLISSVAGSKILFYVSGSSSYSHRGSVQPLANKLASRGHEVTFLSPYDHKRLPYWHPTITEFCPDGMKEFNEKTIHEFGVEGLKERVDKEFSNDLLDKVTKHFDQGRLMCETILNGSKFREWLDKVQFDLVIIDNALNECAFGISYLLKAKTILYSSLAAVLMWDMDLFGIPPEISWVPGLTTVSKGDLTFFDRLLNAVATYSLTWTYKSYYLPKMENLLRQTFGPRLADMPNLETVIQNTSLLFINSHYSDQFQRSFPPSVIQVGGMTLDEAEAEAAKNPKATLPSEIKKFIEDENSRGFIYISFGSMVKFSTIPKQLIQAFFDTIQRFPDLRFLWKWEENIPADAPPNILFQTWFPQLDILAHPKALGIVMQGGQVSVQQAICNGLPIIMFPIMGDQDFNAKRLRMAGNGIEMELAGLIPDKFADALKKILDESIYRTKVKQLAKACRDRPMSALDTAVWWTEFVLRTDDTSFLKPLSMHQSLWTQWSMDIFFFIFCVGALATILVLAVLGFILCKIIKLTNSTKLKPKTS